MKNSIKLFDKELREFEQYIKDKKNFAFVRFSDGELFILQNKKVILSSNQYQTGDTIGRGTYTQEEQKEFLPEKHQHFRELLLDSFVYDDRNFYKGISCRCCVGKDNFIWQLRTIYNNKEKVQNAALAEYSNLTWSNLFLNNNYKYYIENIVPLFSQFDVYLIVNEMADITTLPFYSNIKQDFRVGSNCIINNLDLAQQLPQYIQDNNIKNSLFLFSASSLSNVVTYECYKTNKNNIYLDIGTTLNPYMKGMEGWRYSRDYLTNYWFNKKNNIGERVCVW